MYQSNSLFSQPFTLSGFQLITLSAHRRQFQEWAGISGNSRHFRCKFGRTLKCQHRKVHYSNRDCIQMKHCCVRKELGKSVWSCNNDDLFLTVLQLPPRMSSQKNTLKTQLLFSALLSQQSVPQDLKGFLWNQWDLPDFNRLNWLCGKTCKKHPRQQKNNQRFLDSKLHLQINAHNGGIMSRNNHDCFSAPSVIVQACGWAWALALFPQPSRHENGLT